MLVQLAELRQQMTAMGNSVDEIKSSVKEVIALDRTIAELSIHYQQQAKEIQTQWAKIDTNHRDIENVEKAAQNSTRAVDSKAEEWINKARGAWWTAMIFGGSIQLGMLAMMGWTFTHIRSAEDGVLLLNQRVIQLEQQRGPRQ